MRNPAARRTLAASIGLGLLVFALFVVGFRDAPAPSLSLVSALVAGNAMTAYVLIALAIQRRASTTALLGCAYIVTIVTYNVCPPIITLVFPGTAYPAVALSFVGHVGFAAFFAGYLPLARRERQASVLEMRAAFTRRVALALAFAALLSIVATLGIERAILSDAGLERILPFSIAPISFIVLVFFLVRAYPTVSNTWLGLALWASTLDAAMLCISQPGTLGTFTAQVFGLVSCMIIPAVYLVEFNRQYAWLSRSHATFRRQALVDELTGLGNRRYYDARIESLCKNLIGHPDAYFSLLAIDVDHFKAYNDAFGHVAGDECLRKIASTIAASLHRDVDEATRYGGEEFAVLLPNIDDAGARVIAERIREAVWNLDLSLGPDTSDRVTVSIGIAVAPRDGVTPEAVFGRADAALYTAKRLGRNLTALASEQKVPNE
jgi:diguanylate cyclase (GGDEF)-like protein